MAICWHIPFIYISLYFQTLLYLRKTDIEEEVICFYEIFCNIQLVYETEESFNKTAKQIVLGIEPKAKYCATYISMVTKFKTVSVRHFSKVLTILR